MRSLLVVLVAACGDSSTAAPDGAIDVDAAPDASPPGWSAPVMLSDPANASFVPAIATRGEVVVIAWHDFPAGASETRVVTRVITGGVIGPITPLPDAGAKRPAIAATTTGFVLAWDAANAIRAIDLDAAGAAIGAPVTISSAAGSVVHVAAHGDDVVFAWTDGSAHFWARRGPIETVAASAVGTTLLSGGILNFPRVAVTSTGTVLIAYRDGGTDTTDWETLLVIHEPGGPFAGPLNVSRSPGLLSDDISLATRPDDTLDLVWVDQAPENVNNFETTHATRDAAGAISAPARFATQNTETWTPSATVGGAAWHSGPSAAGGDLWLSTGAAPEAIPSGEAGGMVALAADGGAFHVAYVTVPSPRQIRYLVRR